MSTRLEEILERDLARSARAFDNARVTYTMLRNGLVGLGLSGAIFLPLAGSEPSTPEGRPPPPTEVRQTYNDYHYYGNEPPDGGTAAEPPNIHIDLVSHHIQGAPPMNRDWHRTTFSQTGDEFWALPDASFIMRFTQTNPWDPDCLQDSCNGFFSFTSERYLGTSEPIAEAWEVKKGRQIESQNIPQPHECRRLRTPVENVRVAHTEVEFCRFIALDRSQTVMSQTANRPDLCIWMRRSDHLEQPEDEEGTVALDVRWTRRDLSQESCPELTPGQ